MASNKHKKMIRISMLTWMLMIITAIAAIITAQRNPIVPKKWLFYAIIAIAVIAILLLLFSAHAHRGWKRVVSTILNCLVAACMIALTVFLPYLETSINNMFHTTNEETYIINVYGLTQDYKNTHLDTLSNTVVSTNLSDYQNSTFITQTASDTDNTNYAVEQVKSVLGNISLDAEDSPVTALQALYDGKGDALILSANYASIFDDIEAYSDFSKNTQIIASYTRVTKSEEPAVEPAVEDNAFTVYVAGSDTRDTTLVANGRFDVNMLVTVNPNTHQIMITNIPRDSYIPNLALGGGLDKLTHCGLPGVQNSVNSISNWLGVNIDNYAVVNFVTFEKIIDAIDGVDVENPYAFSASNLSGTYFPEGTIHLSGKAALEYCRERYSLPDGDFGRNLHQGLVMKAIISKLTSSAMIANFGSVMNALNGAFLTDMDINKLYSLANETLSSGASWDVMQYRILGTTGGAETASMPGQVLSCVFPYQSNIDFVNQQITAMENNEELTH